jgi:TM2 domain-containing membrane protein YozV
MPVKKNVAKVPLLLITFFLGGLGAHKFYLGKKWQGLFYLLFFWTAVPALIAFIEFIIYASTSNEKLQEKYPAGGSMVMVIVTAVFAGLILFLSLLAALVVPRMFARIGHAKQKATYAQIELLGQALDMFHLDVGRYPTTSEGLQSLLIQPNGIDGWNGPYLKIRHNYFFRCLFWSIERTNLRFKSIFRPRWI